LRGHALRYAASIKDVEMFRREPVRYRMWLLLLAAVVGIGLQGEVRAGEQIVRAGAGSQAEEPGSRRDQAMLAAVLREADTILPYSLGSDRKSRLARFLRSRYETYVLSYSQQAENEDQEQVWQVQVNTQALASLLKDLGVYYTGQKKLDYRLEMSGTGQGGIAQLEDLSGCVQKGVVYPVLKVQSADGRFRGVLESQTSTWTATRKSLEELWLALWSKYFASPEGIRPFVHRVQVQIKGLSTVSAVSGCSRQLQGWHQAVAQAGLVQIKTESGGLVGWWDVLTPEKDRLRRRLNAYTRARGLQWEERAGAGEQEQRGE
jgi:hypothetical protein